MGISETYFHEEIEAVEEQYRRRMPAKPRSVKIEEAMRRLKLVDGQRDRCPLDDTINRQNVCLAANFWGEEEARP